ncbi:uncharacterized protein LOC144127586 isoform X1 [Amblyomma americanum]
MSGLLRWETAFFLADEGFHLVRAAHDLGTVMDACVYGIPTVEAMVCVLASLVLFAFHALFLGPRSSLASDAAIFFGDMQFHFFHMLLGTWQLIHYLWTTQKREVHTYVCRWSCFLFHTGIVWFYTGGIQVSIRMQFGGAPANHPPPPPPMPPAPNPEAVVLAIAAARAAEAAAARAASRNNGNGVTARRDSRSTPQGTPTSHLSTLTNLPRDADRELGSAGHPCSSRRDSTQDSLSGSGSQRSPADLPAIAAAAALLSEAAPESRPSAPEDSAARTAQTLSSSSPVCSTTALVPYVERPQRTESPQPGELHSDGQAAWDASSDAAAASSISAVGLPAAASTSEPAANGARSNISAPTPGSAAEMTFGGSSELVLDLAESSVQSPVLVPKVATAPAAAQDSAPGASSRIAQSSEKPGPSRETSAKPSPRTSRKPSSATPPKSPK